MLDNVLFILNEDITNETVLAVLSAVQAFENNAVLKNNAHNKAHKQNRLLELKLCIVCSNPEYDILWNRCLSNLFQIYRNNLDVYEQRWTYVAEISITRALEIGTATKKPLAEAIGILIGAEAGSLPDVSNLCQQYETKVYALIDSALPKTSLDEDYTKVRLKYQFGASIITLADSIEAVFSSKIVIGYSSFETYLACALKKPVLEVQRSSHLYKWSNPRYFCITDDKSKLFQEHLSKGIQLCQASIGA